MRVGFFTEFWLVATEGLLEIENCCFATPNEKMDLSNNHRVGRQWGNKNGGIGLPLSEATHSLDVVQTGGQL